MRHWFKDQHFRSLLKNTSYLGVSKAVAALAGVATLAFAGRGLGVILFGTLILITSYVKAVSGIAKFQSWQLIVRYGGHGVAHGDPEHFKVATGFAFALDMLSGIGGMTVIARASPRASVIVVDVVGAIDSGPTSAQRGSSRVAVPASASMVPEWPVIAMIGIFAPWKWSITASSSDVSPLWEIRIATSPRAAMPRSP